jgi:hypothetical protein
MFTHTTVALVYRALVDVADGVRRHKFSYCKPRRHKGNPHRPQHSPEHLKGSVARAVPETLYEE